MNKILGHECNVVPGYYLYHLVINHGQDKITFRNTMSDFQNHPQLWAEQCPYTLKDGDTVEPCIVKNSATETLAAIQKYIDRELELPTKGELDEYWSGYWKGVNEAVLDIQDIIRKQNG